MFDRKTSLRIVITRATQRRLIAASTATPKFGVARQPLAAKKCGQRPAVRQSSDSVDNQKEGRQAASARKTFRQTQLPSRNRALGSTSRSVVLLLLASRRLLVLLVLPEDADKKLLIVCQGSEETALGCPPTLAEQRATATCPRAAHSGEAHVFNRCSAFRFLEELPRACVLYQATTRLGMSCEPLSICCRTTASASNIDHAGSADCAPPLPPPPPPLGRRRSSITTSMMMSEMGPV